MKILVINGPNLNFLGIRNPGVYGSESYDELIDRICSYAVKKNIETEFYQNNSEGALIDRLQQAYLDGIDGVVINPGAYTHYSYAIRDALEPFCVPVIEVHISDIKTREDFRHISVTAPVCTEQICGLGTDGYLAAIDRIMIEYNKKNGGRDESNNTEYSKG